MENKISIVVPVREKEPIISGLLESINKQTVKPYEVVFVIADDDEDSLQTINEWIKTQHYCKVQIWWRYHHGIPDAKQYGSLRATGDIIAHTDADTELNDRWIETIIKEIHNCPFIYGSVRMKKNNIPSYIYQKIGYEIFPPVLKYFNIPVTVGSNIAIIRKEFYNVGGFNKNLHIGEDSNLAMRCSSHKYVPSMKVITSNRRVDTWFKVIRYAWYCLRYFIVGDIKEYK